MPERTTSKNKCTFRGLFCICCLEYNRL